VASHRLFAQFHGGTRVPERILVVDDNRDAADTLARLIRSFGHEVKTVYDGLTALEEVGEFEPDMALVDIGMPGLNGYETISQLRQRRGNVHLIAVAVTAWSRDEDKLQAYESGFDLHVAKPMTLEKLKELLLLLDPHHAEGGFSADAPGA
jgi:CheY-like chemotaxis protein